MTLVLMVVVPIIVLVAKQYGSIVQKLRKKFQDELAAAGTTAEESISNIRKKLLTSFSPKAKTKLFVFGLFIRNCAYLWRREEG